MNSKSLGIISAIIIGIIVISITVLVMQDDTLNETVSESSSTQPNEPMNNNQSDGKQFSISLHDGITTKSSP